MTSAVEREQLAADHLLAALRGRAAQFGIEAGDIELLQMLLDELEELGDHRVAAVVALCDRYDVPPEVHHGATFPGI